MSRKTTNENEGRCRFAATYQLIFADSVEFVQLLLRHIVLLEGGGRDEQQGNNNRREVACKACANNTVALGNTFLSGCVAIKGSAGPV